MARRRLQHALKTFQRVVRPAEAEQRHATAVEQFHVVRRDAQACVKAFERPLALLERKEDKAEA